MRYFSRRYSPPGSAPGTLTPHPAAEHLPLGIRLMEYDAHTLEERDDIGAEQCHVYLQSPTLTWIHVHGHAAPEIVRELGERFGLHALALEDVLNTGQRPKAEDYDGLLFVIAALPVQRAAHLEFEQISLFLGRDYLISFHSGADDVFDPVRQRLRAQGSRLRKQGPDALLHALLDGVVDQGFPLLERFGERLETLEDELLRPQTDNSMLGRLHGMRRELLMLRRMLWPQREMLTALIHNDRGLVHDQTKPYLRDCHDHAVQIMDLLETYREVITAMLEVYLSAAGNRLNDIIRVLTIITTLFIPPTFLVGVYGMNFDVAHPWNMPELGWRYGYLMVWAIIALTIGGMLMYFKRKKWF